MAYHLAGAVETELDGIWLFIANESRSVEIADRVVEAITHRFLLLSKYPHLGRRRDDLRAGLRSFTAEGFVIIYRLTGADVMILHILHGSRDIASLI